MTRIFVFYPDVRMVGIGISLFSLERAGHGPYRVGIRNNGQGDSGRGSRMTAKSRPFKTRIAELQDRIQTARRADVGKEAGRWGIDVAEISAPDRSNERRTISL